jgi:Alginate lyase
MKFAAFLLLVLLSPVASGQGAPRLCSMDAALLQQSRARLKPDDAAFAALRRDAARALKAEPFSVTRKERTAPSGDKHDYLSFAPYWWPDPTRAEGLPYIRRDGETNPDNKRGTDANAIGAMADAVESLALTFYFSGEARYAEGAARLIRAWFLDPPTRMNPHMRYAQAIPGRNDGRGAGLIESRHFIRAADAAGLLGASRAWTENDRQALAAWFREFADWMQTSPNGKDEAKAENNHGSWCAAQLACFAWFTGDQALARRTVEGARARIARQIEADGRQPRELQRTRGLWYSGFNLEALLILAEMGRHTGMDLYHFQSKDGRGIRRAVDYLAPYADPARPWPHRQINERESARRELAYVLRRAGIAYREPKYETRLMKHLAAEAAEERWQLAWPAAGR